MPTTYTTVAGAQLLNTKLCCWDGERRLSRLALFTHPGLPPPWQCQRCTKAPASAPCTSQSPCISTMHQLRSAVALFRGTVPTVVWPGTRAAEFGKPRDGLSLVRQFVASSPTAMIIHVQSSQCVVEGHSTHLPLWPYTSAGSRRPARISAWIDWVALWLSAVAVIAIVAEH